MSVAQSNNVAPIFIDFIHQQELKNWIVVNDTVMGGRSRTRLSIDDAHLGFSGILSLANNGGFASIRRVYDAQDWSGGKVIQIFVLGDGRSYQFRLRTNRRSDGVAYVVNFPTLKGELSELVFQESDFVPQFRGRLVKGAPELNFADIQQIGFMLADDNAGEFSLKIRSIRQQK